MHASPIRDRLLAAGLASIHAQGFAATGVQEITGAAGVPKGSFYNHFPSKAAFGLAVLEAYWKGAAGPVALLEEPGRGARDRIARHFRALQASLAAAGHELGCLLGNFAVEGPSLGAEVRARVAECYAEWTGALARCLDAGAAAGEIRRDIAPVDLARTLLAAWQGTVQRAKAEANTAGFDAFFRSLDRLIAP